MAGLIPQSFIDDLLARADIVEVVDKRVALKKAGQNYTACCPFHNEKTTFFAGQTYHFVFPLMECFFQIIFHCLNQ